MKRAIICLLFVLAFASLVACGSSGGSSSGGNSGGGGSNQNTFTGVVTHGGVGISGVAVTALDAGRVVRGSGTSGAGGAYSFKMIGFDDPNSGVMVHFHMDGAGYVDSEFPLTINKGQTYIVNGTV